MRCLLPVCERLLEDLPVVQGDPLFTFHVTTRMRKRHVRQREYETDPTPRVQRTLTPDLTANDYGY